MTPRSRAGILPGMSSATESFTDCLRRLRVSGQVVEFEAELPTAVAAAERLDCPLGAI